MNYALLTIYADLLDDLERSRIATENRIRSLRDVKGLAGSPEEERLDAIAGCCIVTYLVRVTHPWHKASVSTEYAPKEYEVDTPELAVQLFRAEAGPMRLDLSRAVERLDDGKELRWQDKETGRTVTAQVKATHLVTVTYPKAEDDRDDLELKAGSIDRAAELVESECSECDYDTVLEALETTGRFEDVDEETGRVILARELAEAVV